MKYFYIKNKLNNYSDQTFSKNFTSLILFKFKNLNKNYFYTRCSNFNVFALNQTYLYSY